jgi:hypothetical protein
MEPIVNLVMIALDITGVKRHLSNLLLKDCNIINDAFEHSENKMNESTSKLRSKIKAQKLLINDFSDTFCRLK